MNKPFQVGITGGIGSGKSIVCKIFAQLGVPIYDADSRAKWLNNFDPDLKKAIISIFGAEAYTSEGLNRNYLANIVFNNQAKLAQLNNITHPAVAKDYEQWLNNQKAPYVIKEAALMFESGSHKMMDIVVNVTAPIELRISRVLARDTFRNEAEIRAIMAKQLSEEERQKKADFLVYNDEKQLLIPQLLKLHKQFLSRNKKG